MNADLTEDAVVRHVVLQTDREEIAETCRDPRHAAALGPCQAEEVARWIEAAPDTEIGQIAVHAGHFVIEGFDYWDALVLAAKRGFDSRASN